MTTSLLFIGDSLTQWCDWERRFPGYRVANLGIAGETAEGLLARWDRIRALTDNPDYVFLMSGINNIAAEQYDITVPYREIVRHLTTAFKRSTVIVQSILPVELTWISNDVIKDINRHLAEIAREYNAEYLDVYSSFVDRAGNPLSEYFQEDGVHVSKKGYDAWTKEVERFLHAQAQDDIRRGK